MMKLLKCIDINLKIKIMGSLFYLILGIILLVTGMMWLPVGIETVMAHYSAGAISIAHAIFGDHSSPNDNKN